MKLSDQIMAAAWLLFIGIAVSFGFVVSGHHILGALIFGIFPLSFGWSYKGHVSKKESVGNTLVRPFWLIILLAAWLLFRIAWLGGIIIRRGRYRRPQTLNQAESPV